MKKQLVVCCLLALIITGCQQPSKVTILDKGPEIDNLTKTMDAYVNADWATYRAAFADTARIVFNNMNFDPDSLVRFQQSRRQYYDKVEMSQDAIEFIRYENGDEWTHYWGKLKLTVKGTGRVVEIPIHMAGRQASGKTVEQYAYFNSQEITEAIKEAMTPPAPPAK